MVDTKLNMKIVKAKLGKDKRFLLVLLACLACVSCASFFSPSKTDMEVCANADWWELGRQDGARGMSLDFFKTRTQKCPSTDKLNRENLYVNGRNSGLIDYCQANNGYEIGRTGQLYFYVCPIDVESEFLTQYRKGKKVYQLELANKTLTEEIDRRISRLERNQGISTQEKVHLGKQIQLMKSARAQNEKSLHELRPSQGG